MDQGWAFIKHNLHNITNAQGQTVLVAQWQPLTTYGQQGFVQNSSGQEAASFPLLAQHAVCSACSELSLWPLKLYDIKAAHSPSQHTSQALSRQSSVAMFLPLSLRGSFQPPLEVGFLVWIFSKPYLGMFWGSSWSWVRLLVPPCVEPSLPSVKMLECDE